MVFTFEHGCENSRKKERGVVGLTALGHWAAGLGSRRWASGLPRRELSQVAEDGQGGGGQAPVPDTATPPSGERRTATAVPQACPGGVHQPHPPHPQNLCGFSQTHLTAGPYSLVLPSQMRCFALHTVQADAELGGRSRAGEGHLGPSPAQSQEESTAAEAPGGFPAEAAAKPG